VELPSQSVLKQQVLDRLILQEIQAQRAKRVGLTVSDEQLNGALQEIAQRNKIPFDQLPTALEAQGVDYKQYRESMRKELTLSTLRQRDVIAHINVTPRELDQYLTRQQTSAANDEFNVSHILLSLPAAATPPAARRDHEKGPGSFLTRGQGRGLRPTCHCELEQPNRPRRRPIGMAQGDAAAPVHFGSGHQNEGRRSERTRAHPKRLSHRQAQRAPQRANRRSSSTRSTCATSC